MTCPASIILFGSGDGFELKKDRILTFRIVKAKLKHKSPKKEQLIWAKVINVLHQTLLY